MKFYDVHEQTKYKITISCPSNPEELSDLFVTHDEMTDLIGGRWWGCSEGQTRTYLLKNVIEAEVKKWCDKLDASGRKTLEIKDEELLKVLKEGYFSDFTPGINDYGRHGNRVCYARRYKRVKKKATKKDVREIWYAFQYAFRDKFDCYPSHIPTYDRHPKMFKAFQKMLGWKNVVPYLDIENRKFYRQIWENPEEYV